MPPFSVLLVLHRLLRLRLFFFACGSQGDGILLGVNLVVAPRHAVNAIYQNASSLRTSISRIPRWCRTPLTPIVGRTTGWVIFSKIAARSVRRLWRSPVSYIRNTVPTVCAWASTPEARRISTVLWLRGTLIGSVSRRELWSEGSAYVYDIQVTMEDGTVDTFIDRARFIVTEEVE